jgi:hypothetical protein
MQITELVIHNRAMFHLTFHSCIIYRADNQIISKQLMNLFSIVILP